MFMLRKHRLDIFCLVYCMVSFAVKSFEECIFVSFLLLIKQRFSIINQELLKMTNEFPNEILITSKSDVKTIIKMRRFHFKLCSIGKQLNNNYSLSILIIIALTFLEFTNRAYYTYHMIQDFITDPENNYDRRLITTGLTVLLNGLELFCVSVVCNLVKKEAK